MQRLVASIMVVLCGLTARADDPHRHVQSRPELLFDPADDEKVVARFRSESIVRDAGMPGTPITKIKLGQGEHFDDEDVSCLAKLPYLRVISVIELSGKQLRMLSRLRQLEDVTVDRVKPGADDIEALSTLPRLRSLNIVRANISDDALAALRKFPQLQTLSVGGCKQFTDAGIKVITGLKNIRSLTLWGTAVTDKGLAELSALDQLEDLDLGVCRKVTGAGFKTLAHCSKLRQLDLSGCEQLTDKDLEGIGHLDQLQKLDLNGCPDVTDDGLPLLTGLRRLKTLTLVDSGVTGRGLTHLAQLSQLKYLDVRFCHQMSADDVNCLRTALPGCTIKGP